MYIEWLLGTDAQRGTAPFDLSFPSHHVTTPVFNTLDRRTLGCIAPGISGAGVGDTWLDPEVPRTHDTDVDEAQWRGDPPSTRTPPGNRRLLLEVAWKARDAGSRMVVVG